MPGGYRLVSYAGARRKPQAGVLIDGLVLSAEDVLGQPGLSVIDILRMWDEAHPRLAKAARSSGTKGIPVADVKMLAPILYPGALFCAGANYWDHLQEMAEIAKRTTGKEVSLTKPAEPWFFMKTTAGSIVGDGAPVRLPRFSKQVDWEAELGAVIARPTRNIPESDALNTPPVYLSSHTLSPPH